MIFSFLKPWKGKRNGQPDYTSLSDEELMKRFAGGDAQAFDELVSRHEKPLFRFILRSCNRPELAEELLQETFLRVIKSADRYKPTAKFTTWIYTIARNICIDRARKNRPRETSLDAPLGPTRGEDHSTHTLSHKLVDDTAKTTQGQYERERFRKALQCALDALPEEQREVFLLKEVSGLTFREIAEVVGTGIPTVKSRMRYALESLRNHLHTYRDHRFDDDEHDEVAGPTGTLTSGI